MGSAAYLLVFLLVLLETIILIGHFIPGGVFLAFVGFLAYLQVFDFGAMLTTVFVAHYLGEHGNYWLGRPRGRALFTADAKWLKLSYLDAAQRRFRSGGALIVVTGQLVGMLRPLLSFVAGASHYPRLRFAVYIGMGSFLWALLHLGVGFVLGASWEQASGTLEGVSVLLVVVVLSLWLSAWLVQVAVENAGQLGRWLEQASRRIHASQAYGRIAARSPRLFRFLEARLSLSRPWGIGASLGWLLAALLMGCFLLIMHGVRRGDTWQGFDFSLVNLMAQLRSPSAERFFVFFTHLGDGPAVAAMAAAAVLAALAFRQRRSAFVIAASLGLAGLLSNVIKVVYARARPDASLALVDSAGFSFPSGHSTMCVALFGALYYWLWNHPGRMRVWVSTAFVLVVSVFLVGFSRIYLGVHYPSDVVAGFALGLACVVIATTLAHNIPALTDRAGRADWPVLTLVLVAVALSGVRTFGPLRKPPPAASRLASPPTAHETSSTLLAGLPRAAQNLTGRLVVPTNLVVAGDPAPLRERLLAQGWRVVPPKGFFTREVAAPIFPAFVGGKPAELTMEKRDGASRMLLRLWHADATLRDAPAWVGSAVEEQSRRSAFGLQVYRVAPDLDAATDRLAASLAGMPGVSRTAGFRERNLYAWRQPFFTHGGALVVVSCGNALQ
jgi:undecaprenyl-diphosphatase